MSPKGGPSLFVWAHSTGHRNDFCDEQISRDLAGARVRTAQTAPGAILAWHGAFQALDVGLLWAKEGPVRLNTTRQSASLVPLGGSVVAREATSGAKLRSQSTLVCPLQMGVVGSDHRRSPLLPIHHANLITRDRGPYPLSDHFAVW